MTLVLALPAELKVITCKKSRLKEKRDWRFFNGKDVYEKFRYFIISYFKVLEAEKLRFCYTTIMVNNIKE